MVRSVPVQPVQQPAPAPQPHYAQPVQPVQPVQPIQPQYTQPAPQPVQPVMPNPVYSNVFDAGLDTPVAAPKAAPVEEEDDSDYFNDLLSILNKRS